MTSDIWVGRGVQDSPKIGRYRVGQGRLVGQKWPKTWDVINGRSPAHHMFLRNFQPIEQDVSYLLIECGLQFIRKMFHTLAN